MSRYDFCESLCSINAVETTDGVIRITTTDIVQARQPVTLCFGPAFVELTIPKAIELGNELIASAHRWQAALAEYQQALAQLGTPTAGGDA